jgi:hypothetical protein
VRQKTASPWRPLLPFVQYGIDVGTAVLLLTGQITTSGIFVVPEGFYLAATGPILGGVRSKGRTVPATAALDGLDALVAILLLLNLIRVTGPYISSRRWFIAFSGSIFGIKDIGTTEMPNEQRNRQALEIRRHIRSALVDR